MSAAARLADLDADELPGDALNIDPRAAEFLGAFYAFADAQLQSLRADAEDPSPIHLWPEHFDLAFDAGDEAAGQRATYGASPGDEKHPEPYLYVAPRRTPAPSMIWNAHGFSGAELTWAELVIDEDPRAAALDLLARRARCTGVLGRPGPPMVTRWCRTAPRSRAPGSRARRSPRRRAAV